MKRVTFYIILILILIIGSLWLLDYQSNNVIRGDYYCNGHMRMYCGQSSFGYGLLGMVITWGVILFLGVLIYRLIFNDNEKEKEAIRILNKKLANGDISIEEYQRIKSEIEKD